MNNTPYIKAPTGGMVSVTNGQFYEGGEFMPIHGLFCGKKGVKRKARADKYAAVGRFIDAGGAKLWEVFERSVQQSHVSYAVGMVVADSEKAAVAAMVAARVKASWAKEI